MDWGWRRARQRADRRRLAHWRAGGAGAQLGENGAWRTWWLRTSAPDFYDHTNVATQVSYYFLALLFLVLRPGHLLLRIRDEFPDTVHPSQLSQIRPCESKTRHIQFFFFTASPLAFGCLETSRKSAPRARVDWDGLLCLVYCLGCSRFAHPGVDTDASDSRESRDGQVLFRDYAAKDRAVRR